MKYSLLLVLFFTSPLLAQQSDWQIYGDARVRSEFNDTTTVAGDEADRHRMRHRLRVGAKYTASDDLTFNLRLVTGDNDDPNSVHQDAGDVFNTFPVSLDRLHFTWSMNDDLDVMFGKFANPIFRNPIYGELVWDGDVSPEGIAFVHESGPMTMSFGQYVVTEDTASQDADAWMSVASVDSSHDNFVFGASYSFYGNMNGKGVFSGDNRTNAGSGDTFLSDFGILDAVVAYNMDNLMFSVEMIENMRADDSVGSSGLAFGVSYKMDNGDKFYIQHQAIDQDAIFTGFSQDDTLSQASNYEGQILGYKTKFENGLGMHVWGMAVAPSDLDAATGSVSSGDETEYRFRVDFNLKF